MRKISPMLVLLALLVSHIPAYAQSGPPQPAPGHYVIVHIGNDGCPESTRVGTKNGNATRCKISGKSQADAVCVSNGAVIEWRSSGGGNTPFSITEKNGATSLFNGSCVPTISPSNRIRCTVAATNGSGSHHYNVETSSCLLDPMIFLN